MDRIFLDANILFSAAYMPAGGLKRLWLLAREGKAELLSSTYAVEEASRNLSTEAQTRNLQKLLRRVTVSASSMTECRQVEAADLPEKDRPILQAAIDMKATHLLTGDVTHFGHLYGMTIEGVTILTPAEYLKGR